MRGFELAIFVRLTVAGQEIKRKKIHRVTKFTDQSVDKQSNDLCLRFSIGPGFAVLKCL